MAARMDPARIALLAQQRGLGIAPLVLGTVSSTNDVARMLAQEGAPHGTSVLSDDQRAGRGRLGRIWQAAPGECVCASIVLRPQLPPDRVPLLCLAAAVAAAGVCGPSYRIKWPNDVLDGAGRKIAGILAEADLASSNRHVVLGIGLNVGGSPEGMQATSLSEAGDARSIDLVAVELLAEVLSAAALLERDLRQLLDLWRARSATLGARVSVGSARGLARDIDETGALLVETEAGGVERVLAGDVSMIG